jgi:hypothetical protein
MELANLIMAPLGIALVGASAVLLAAILFAIAPLVDR